MPNVFSYETVFTSAPQLLLLRWPGVRMKMNSKKKWWKMGWEGNIRLIEFKCTGPSVWVRDSIYLCNKRKTTAHVKGQSTYLCIYTAFNKKT